MKKPFPIFSLHRLAQSFLAAGTILAATLIMALIGQQILGQGVVALLYLLPIAWSTVRWGRLAGLSAALTASLCFNFFFIQPIYTFNIGSVEGWLIFLLFTAVSIFAVGRIQAMISEEKQRERNAIFMYELMASMAHLQTVESIARAIAGQIQQTYLARCVQVNLYPRQGLPAMVRTAPEDSACPAEDKPDQVLTLLSGPSLVGDISIWQGRVPLPTENDRMVQSFLRQTALAIDYARATEEKKEFTNV